jgi:hypothetical protein
VLFLYKQKLSNSINDLIFFGGADGALSIVEIDNGYVTAGWVRDTLNKLSIGIIQLDINGNEVNRKTYHPLDYQAYWPGSAGAFIKGIDENYYMCGSVRDTTPCTRRCILI